MIGRPRLLVFALLGALGWPQRPATPGPPQLPTSPPQYWFAERHGQRQVRIIFSERGGGPTTGDPLFPPCWQLSATRMAREQRTATPRVEPFRLGDRYYLLAPNAQVIPLTITTLLNCTDSLAALATVPAAAQDALARSQPRLFLVARTPPPPDPAAARVGLSGPPDAPTRAALERLLNQNVGAEIHALRANPDVSEFRSMMAQLDAEMAARGQPPAVTHDWSYFEDQVLAGHAHLEANFTGVRLPPAAAVHYFVDAQWKVAWPSADVHPPAVDEPTAFFLNAWVTGGTQPALEAIDLQADIEATKSWSPGAAGVGAGLLNAAPIGNGAALLLMTREGGGGEETAVCRFDPARGLAHLQKLFVNCPCGD